MDFLDGKKKILASVIAAIMAGVGVYLDFDIKEIATVIAPVIAYIFAQGFADLGKEAEKFKR